MALPKPLNSIFQYIEQNEDKFIDRLRTAVAISSITNSQENENSILAMTKWTNDLLKSLGIETELKDVKDSFYKGTIPPVIFGNLGTGTCPNKATILVYGNLDVKDAKKEEGWKNDPFQLFVEDSCLFGRGILNKSTVVAWLNTIDIYQTLGITIPVNIKFVFEFMGTQGSLGLKDLLQSEKEKFLAHVDYVCITKGSWLQPEIPCIIHSLKGLCSFSIEVECASRNLDSNIYSGMIQEAMSDLIILVKSLLDEEGNLNIPLFNLETELISDEEKEILRNANFDEENFIESAGINCLSHNGNLLKILRHRMGLPTLSIHNIESSCKESKELEIPGVVIAKLSIRTLYNQTPEEIFQRVKNYLENRWLEYGSKNKMKVCCEKTLNAWHEDVNHVHYQTAVKAIKLVYGMDPCFMSNGYVIPIVNILTEVTNKKVILLPTSLNHEYDVNENLRKVDYINAIKLFAAYLYEMGALPKLWSQSSSSFESCKSQLEVCVCDKFEQEIQAASGDAEQCVCPDISYKSKPVPIDDDERTVCNCEKTVDKTEAIELPRSLIPMKCKCLLVPSEISPRPPSPIGEIMSLMSNASTASRDPTPVLISTQKQKKNITPSIETIKCVCIPKAYRNITRQDQKVITPERQEELMKSMKFVGSEISGKSAGESNENLKTPRMAILGCVCPETSIETICDEMRQIDQMSCPTTKKKQEQLCTKGGKRKHHIVGPPPIDEEESEISMGPLSHCSCSSNESIPVIPECDCKTENPLNSLNKNTKNLENEVD